MFRKKNFGLRRIAPFKYGGQAQVKVAKNGVQQSRDRQFSLSSILVGEMKELQVNPTAIWGEKLEGHFVEKSET